MRPAVARCKKTMLACGVRVRVRVRVERAGRAESRPGELWFGCTRRKKAALLRDLGMGTHADAGRREKDQPRRSVLSRNGG